MNRKRENFIKIVAPNNLAHSVQREADTFFIDSRCILTSGAGPNGLSFESKQGIKFYALKVYESRARNFDIPARSLKRKNDGDRDRCDDIGGGDPSPAAAAARTVVVILILVA